MGYRIDSKRMVIRIEQGSGAGVPTLNQTSSTLRFFFKVTLGRPDIVERTAFVHEPSKLPVVLSPEEVGRLLDAAPSLKYKMALSVAYGAGLRASEVVAPKVTASGGAYVTGAAERFWYKRFVAVLQN
jgi:integrase